MRAFGIVHFIKLAGVGFQTADRQAGRELTLTKKKSPDARSAMTQRSAAKTK
jgi:hypothetical protein